jgi:tRNA(Ile2) C34 agmatinyltransferase TiaS
MMYIGLDDTDILESRGTGHLAREIARTLMDEYTLVGVTRHQLLVAPGVPYTKKNSASAILLAEDGAVDLEALADQIQSMMMADFYQGSDPGLCVAVDPPPEIAAFGQRVQSEIVVKRDALDLATEHGLLLRGLGGDDSGVIGALSAVGLAASGDDGRYVLVGRSRELQGLLPVSAILAAGISEVRTKAGDPLSEGLIMAEKLRPARRADRPVLFVTRQGEHWLPLKLD